MVSESNDETERRRTVNVSLSVDTASKSINDDGEAKASTNFDPPGASLSIAEEGDNETTDNDEGSRKGTIEDCSIFRPVSTYEEIDTPTNRNKHYDAARSHSFASEATEATGHASPVKNRDLLAAHAKPKEQHNACDIGDKGSPTVPDKLTPSDNKASPRGPMRRIPRILANRKRVPGGAAAKLIGRRKEEEYHFVNDGDDALEVVAPVDDLIKSRDMAKAEFSKGPTENKRYHAPERHNDENAAGLLPNDGSIPKILDREEVFHQNAAAAIVSLLTPSNKLTGPEIEDILTCRSTDLQVSPSKSSDSKQPKKHSASPFERPARKPDLRTVRSTGSDGNSAAVEDAIEALTMTGKNPLVQHLLTKKTERHLATIKKQMKDPTKNLTELMEAIASPKSGLFDRHYMVRRKNACGAIKVLTANKSHRVNICWTVGVLPALTSVLEDSGSDTLVDMYPNATIRREYFEARKRAVSALLYLAMPQNNKLPIFHCPRLVASLVRVIEQDQDDGEARRGCCAVLAHLSKSKENRLILAQVPGLLDAITSVIEPKDMYARFDDEDSMSSRSDDDSEKTGHTDIFAKLTMDEVGMSLSEKSPTQTMSDDQETQEPEPEPEPEPQPEPEPVLSEEEEDDPAELSARYDEDPDTFLHVARQNVFGLLGHLVKEKDNAYILARHAYLVTTLVRIGMLQESASQDHGLKILAHLSRHRSNSKIMAFKMKDVVPGVVFAMDSQNGEARKYACYVLQNLSQDKPCRQQLVSIKSLLPALCRRIRVARFPEEKLAALHTLKNLTDEPANLIPMTNTPECFATLMQVVHGSGENTTEMMQYLGCDALATLSHWFRSIATSGHRIGAFQRNTPDGVVGKDQLFVPSFRVLAWEPWQ